jgi:hypothetical protein
MEWQWCDISYFAVRIEEVGFKTTAELHNVLRKATQRCVNDISLNPKESMAIVPGRRLFRLEKLRAVYSISA